LSQEEKYPLRISNRKDLKLGIRYKGFGRLGREKGKL
jgi:hypothetical protein